MDNVQVLRSMIRAGEDEMPLYDGLKKTNVGLEVMRTKYVLLLISDLDLSDREIEPLKMISNIGRWEDKCEVLWLPIVNSTTSPSNDHRFNELRNIMPWHSVVRPSLIEPVFVRFVRDVLNFDQVPMVVVLNPEGETVHTDALPMIWIWGSRGFPFTRDRERDLWDESPWNIGLILMPFIYMGLHDRLHVLTTLIAEEKVICLYGGDDIDWIRKFTLSTRAVADALKVPIEMMYDRKRNQTEKVKKCHEIIQRENLSDVFFDNHEYFWSSLLNMWKSKKQIGMTPENDVVMKEIKDLWTLDSSDEGWAIFGRGENQITKAKGDVLLHVIENYNNWGNRVNNNSDMFVQVLDEEIKKTRMEHKCNRLVLPGHEAESCIPERLDCSECGKTMDKYVMYRCCKE